MQKYSFKTSKILSDKPIGYRILNNSWIVCRNNLKSPTFSLLKKNLKQIKILIYKSNIDNLVETYKSLARRVQLFGPLLRDMLKSVLDDIIKNSISLIIPIEDNETWINNIIIAGKR